MSCPFRNPSVQSNETKIATRRAVSHSNGCKTKLQSSWEEGGAPVFVHIIGSQRRGRAQYNRMVGVALQDECERKAQPPETH
eukprot:2324516-Rhodomonas_salina.2